MQIFRQLEEKVEIQLHFFSYSSRALVSDAAGAEPG